MFLISNDKGISKQLDRHGYREEAVVNIMKKEISEGMAVIDIGANLGYFAFLESVLVDNKGVVYAIEPVPDNFNGLLKGVEENGYTNIKPFMLAIGNKNSEMQMQLAHGSNWGTMMNMEYASNFYQKRIRKIGKNYLDVKAQNLDSFVCENKIDKIDFIRMDVEGFENKIVDGMNFVLSNFSPKLFIEFHYSHYEDKSVMDNTINKILSYGYKPKYLIIRKKNQIIDDCDEHNILSKVHDIISKIDKECPHILFEKEANINE